MTVKYRKRRSSASSSAAIVALRGSSLVTVNLRGHYMALATMAFGMLVDALTVGR